MDESKPLPSSEPQATPPPPEDLLANPVATPPPDTLWTPQTVVALGILAIVGGTILGVFHIADLPTINTVSGMVIGTGMGGVCGYYFGGSASGRNKDIAIASLAGAAKVNERRS